MVDPIAFSFGPVQIRWYGILLAFGFFLGYHVLHFLARRQGVKQEVIDDAFLWLIPLSIIGARLFEVVIYNPTYYLANPLKVFFIWEGGISVHGGILGAVIATFIVAKKHTVHFYDIADLYPAPFFLGAALGRIGNFINGELIGKPSTLPWAVEFSNYSGLRHPSQIYESMKNFILFGLALFVKDKSWPRGCKFWLAIGSYSILRFGVEFYKDMPAYGIFTVAQWISLPLMMIAFFMFYRLKKR